MLDFKFFIQKKNRQLQVLMVKLMHLYKICYEQSLVDQLKLL
jgi:hypothetical protein